MLPPRQIDTAQGSHNQTNGPADSLGLLTAFIPIAITMIIWVLRFGSQFPSTRLVWSRKCYSFRIFIQSSETYTVRVKFVESKGPLKQTLG